MSRTVWWTNQGVVVGGIVAVLSLLLNVPLLAAQRFVKSKTHSYPNSPVLLERAKVTLFETFSPPAQFGIPGAARSRVRYANQPLSPTLMLDGRVVCVNRSTQGIEALKLTIVLFDAFHQSISVPGQGASLVKQIVTPLPKNTSKELTWQERMDSTDIYEVAVVLTAVRFADGSIWLAPDVELIDVF